MTNIERVAVIGAGISGLSCAKTLAAAGVNVEVFDKSRGPSGRMSTRRGDGWQCDHGAQYFTARDPRFHAEVEHWIAQGAAAQWLPRIVAIDATGTSAKQEAVDRFVGTPRMTAPARLIADELNLSTSHTVNRICRVRDQWQVAFAEELSVRQGFDAVVLALPSPQAAALLAPVSAELHEVATSTRMTASWALMCRFDQPLALDFDAAFVNTGLLRWVARDNHKPGRPDGETWLLHANAEWSERFVEVTPEAAAKAMIDAFIEIGGTQPNEWSAHRWRYADVVADSGPGFNWKQTSGLGLCGDWLNGGKVEGAWLSGLALAEAMLG